MKIPRRVRITIISWLAVIHCATASMQTVEPPVAIVCAVTGTVTATLPTREKTTLRLFDWIAVDAVIEVGRASSVTLAFASGARYELAEHANARTSQRSLIAGSGAVRTLTPVPPLPLIAPIAAMARPGPRAAAVRIRGGDITGMYPDEGASSEADSTWLRFAALSDASRYHIEIRNEGGGRVFQVETHTATVRVPPGLLTPGVTYYWEVRTVDRIPQAARGTARFVTLDTGTARARAAFKASLEGADDAASLALLAEIDRGLGLLSEAHEELRAAVARAPDDAALRRALERLEQQLGLRREKSQEE
jgi:hypothetical protein